MIGRLTIVVNVDACTRGKDGEGALAILLGNLGRQVLDLDAREGGSLSCLR